MDVGKMDETKENEIKPDTADCQVRRYTTTRPRTLAGAQLYMLARDLLEIKTLKKAENG